MLITKKNLTAFHIGSISTALASPVHVPPREESEFGGGAWALFPHSGW